MSGAPEAAGDGGPLRLLVVTHSLSWGGAERFAATLLGGLDRARFAPAVCVVSRRPPTYPLPDDVEVHRLGYRNLLDLPAAVVRLRRLLRSGRFDVVLSNVLKTNALTGLAMVGLKRPRWVARVGLAPGRGDGLAVRLVASALEHRAAALVANSERMTEGLAERRRSVAARVHHVPNPTDFERIDRLAAEELAPALNALLTGWRIGDDGAGSRYLLVAAGRLERQKRPDLALAALARIRERHDARLVWFGDGPLRDAVEWQVNKLGLQGAAAFPGFFANPFPLVRRADVFVLSSDFEGLPNALIEAQGLGVPAVATRCPFGPDEVISDGATGRLVPTGNPLAFAAAVLELLEASPAARAAMRQAARERARGRYDAARLLRIWEELLAAAAE